MSIHLPDQLTDKMYLSKVSTFQTCPRKYYWQHHLHLQSKDRPSYFTFGSGYHKAVIELGLVYGFPIAEAALQHRFDLFPALGVRPDAKTVEVIQGLAENDRRLMLDMMETFEQRWKAKSREILTTEKSVQYDISHLSPFFKTWVVKADFIFQDDEGLWVGDLKTTAGYGPAVAKYYHSSPQTKTYFWILQQVMPNLRGTKIFVSTKQKVRTEVETILLTDADKYEAELFIGEALRAIDTCEQTAHFPRSMTNCVNSYGQECPYRPLCTQPIKSQAYLDELINNWYRIESPDLHLELED